MLVADVCHSLLAEADEFALKNVVSGRGGPFAAILAVCDLNTGKYVRIGKPSANAVLYTGVASAHAEDQALQPKNVHDLVQMLNDWKQEGREYKVVLASSGQSCQSCHAQEEIVARDLIRQELISAEDFISAYGATFENTAEIAGFSDRRYILDLVRFYHEPESEISMVKHRVAKVGDIPLGVAKLFKEAAEQIAVVARGNEILAVSGDLRSRYDVISTAEVSAIRAACGRQKAEGGQMPWVLGDVNYIKPDPAKAATLYTTSEVGPLMRGVAQWAAVSCITTVRDSEKGKISGTQETPDMPNNKLLHALACGYNYPGSVLHVVHDPSFANKAQQKWKELENKGTVILYNGVDSDKDTDLERFAGFIQTDFKGKALDLTGSGANADLQRMAAGVRPTLKGMPLDL